VVSGHLPHGSSPSDDSIRPHQTGSDLKSRPEIPALILDESALSSLLALATKAKDWPLVAKLGEQLESLAATAPVGVIDLAAARKKRG
jgi:hypothetical protein